MRTIYKPKGLAGEYAEYACNPWIGCTNACKYCYVPAMLRMDREKFHSEQKLKPGFLEALRKQATKYEGKEVFVSFTSDPGPELVDVLRIFQAANIIPIVLAKRWDYIPYFLMTKGWLGTSLTNVPSKKEVYFWQSMKLKWGFKFWISLEPIFDLTETRLTIEHTYRFTDHYKLGRMNYGPAAHDYNWEWVGLCLKEVLEHHRFQETVERGVYREKTFYLKENLRK